MTDDKRRSFEGLVLRALYILLNVITRYHGPKTAEAVSSWKSDARAYLREPWEPSEREIVTAEIIAEHDETLARARAEGRVE